MGSSEANYERSFVKYGKNQVRKALDNSRNCEQGFKMEFLQPRLVLLSAFRYALGRTTYMPVAIVDELRNNWQFLSRQDQIRNDIVRAIERGDAGMDCDVETWKQVLRWGKGGLNCTHNSIVCN